jgi:transposase
MSCVAVHGKPIRCQVDRRGLVSGRWYVQGVSRFRLYPTRFLCTSCGYAGHADVNAACNIRDRAIGHDTAGGRPVAARGGAPWGEPVNREPQLVTS